MMAGAPPPTADGMTVNAALFETSDALAAETLIVPEAETSFPGTFTTMVSHATGFAPGPQPDATDTGESVSLPKCTMDVISSSLPVIVRLKLPLPAVTLVGEIERIIGVFDADTILPPPHPDEKIARLRKDPKRTAFRDMVHHPQASSGDSTAPARCQTVMLNNRRKEGWEHNPNMRCHWVRLGCQEIFHA